METIKPLALARRIEQWTTEKWRSPWVAWPLVCVGFVGAAWISHHPQPPGVSIGLLALVAGVMSVREMPTLEKMAWVAILIAFTVFEVEAIQRAELDNAAKNQAILDGIKQETNATLDALTGGDSYTVITPLFITNEPDNAELPLLVSVAGKNNMFEVSIEMQNGPLDLISAHYMVTHIKEYLEGKVRPSFHFNSISNTHGEPLGAVIHPSPRKVNQYNFWTFSRNKGSREELLVRYNQVERRWELAMKVFRDDAGPVPIYQGDFPEIHAKQP